MPAVLRLLEDGGLPHRDVDAACVEQFLVAEYARAVVGCVGLECRGDAALLRSLAVQASLRKTGLGSRLAQAAEARAQRLGIASLYLLTTAAAAFFERHGYRIVERASAPPAIQMTTQFAELCPAQAVCLCKALA